MSEKADKEKDEELKKEELEKASGGRAAAFVRWPKPLASRDVALGQAGGDD